MATAEGQEPTRTRRARKRRATGADVARHAGLSRATVSYVLNNTPHQSIPEATRERVRASAAELGYTPSAAARALSSGRSDVVLLLLPDWPIGPSVGRLIDDLSTSLSTRGLTFVAHPRSTGSPVADVWKAITPAALITFEELEPAETARVAAAGIDLTVALSGGGRGAPATDLPDQHIGRLQVEHLASTGHRRLGYAWPDDRRVLAFAQGRLEGVRQACAELDLDEPVVVTVPLDVPGATEAVRALRQAQGTEEPAQGADEPTPGGVTGVCAYNDEVALAVLAGARSQGLAVPGDLAVIGADNIAAAALAWPALTTVEADPSPLTGYIAETIVRRLAGRPAPRRPRTQTQTLVVRDSA